MKGKLATCALCGHRFPVALRNRGRAVCSCGLRIGSPSFGVTMGSRTNALAFLLIAAGIVLLTAMVALARRFAG